MWLRSTKFPARHVLLWLLKLSLPLMVIALPVVAIYDRLRPWDVAVHHLSLYGQQARLCVGSGSRYPSSGSEVLPDSYRQRTFVLLPSVIYSPKLVFVTEHLPDRDVTVEESILDFWLLAFTYVGSVWGTWWLWFHPWQRRALPSTPRAT